MRQLGTLNDPAQAQALVDYLLIRGISTKLDPTANGCAIWVRQEDQLDEARQLFTEFQAAPDDEKFRQASETAERLRREELQRDRAALRQHVELRKRWGNHAPDATLVSWLLIGASVSISLLTGFNLRTPLAATLLVAHLEPLEGGYVTYSLLADLAHGEVWRLVTPIFLHLDVAHLLFNMMWVYMLGFRVESILGRWWYLLVVLLSAVGSNVAQYYFAGPGFGGMSGVVYALIGFSWVQYRYAGVTWFYLGPGNMFLAVFWMLLGMTGAMNMANWAHGGGFAIGLALGAAPIVWRKLRF